MARTTMNPYHVVCPTCGWKQQVKCWEWKFEELHRMQCFCCKTEYEAWKHQVTEYRAKLAQKVAAE